jgi:hypothetical protein
MDTPNLKQFLKDTGDDIIDAICLIRERIDKDENINSALANHLKRSIFEYAATLSDLVKKETIDTK